jgi:hypothetical protein
MLFKGVAILTSMMVGALVLAMILDRMIPMPPHRRLRHR